MTWSGYLCPRTVCFMDDNPPGIRRVCMAVDVEQYSEQGITEVAAARRQLSGLLADLCDSPEFDDLLPCQQSVSDGEVVVLPAGIDEPRTVTLLVNLLVHALYQSNGVWVWPHVRLRVAVHEGITTLIGGVFDGPAVKKACGLLGALPLSAALASKPMADLAVIFSDRIYADLGEYLSPEEFTSVEISDPAASFREVGWLLVPERAAPDDIPDAPKRSRDGVSGTRSHEYRDSAEDDSP